MAKKILKAMLEVLGLIGKILAVPMALTTPLLVVVGILCGFAWEGFFWTLFWLGVWAVFSIFAMLTTRIKSELASLFGAGFFITPQAIGLATIGWLVLLDAPLVFMILGAGFMSLWTAGSQFALWMLIRNRREYIDFFKKVFSWRPRRRTRPGVPVIPLAPPGP